MFIIFYSSNVYSIYFANKQDKQDKRKRKSGIDLGGHISKQRQDIVGDLEVQAKIDNQQNFWNGANILESEIQLDLCDDWISSMPVFFLILV